MNAKKNAEEQVTSLCQSQIQLTEEQMKIIELLDLQILECQNQPVSDRTNIPKTAIVQGKAGTGKSVIVSAIVRRVEDQFGHGSVVVLGPTGVSAVNVNGSTIQSKLKSYRRNQNTKIDDDFGPLQGQAAHDLERAFGNVKFVIMDELSMIGCSLISKVDQRLRQATGNSKEDFGGLYIYLFGDIKQLSPVCDCSAYSTDQRSLETIRGKQLYDNINTAFTLTKIHRQNDSVFLQILSNISEGKVTQNDYNILRTRFTTSIPTEEYNLFRNALHLFPMVLQVNNYNKNVLETSREKTTQQQLPVLCVNANHNCPSAKQGTVSKAEGLEPVLYLAKGAKIMLRSNLWTEKGLVNGSMGEIEEIVFSEDAHPSHDPPSVLICKFPSYKEPYLDPVEKTVPIYPLTRSWTDENGNNCSREQFPITLAYATTIHKSQGLTLLKALVDFGVKEKPGLTYVALSRVKSLSGLVLEPFPFSRLKNLSNNAAIKRRMHWEKKLEDKLFYNDSLSSILLKQN